MGRNVEAIASLDRVVAIQAGDDFGDAVEAWSLAEILRQGAGAEQLADDLRYVVVAPALDEEDVARLARRPELLRVPTPHDPSLRADLADTSIFEWLDRPLPAPDASSLTAADLPRLLATVVASPGSLRLSSPDPLTLERAQAELVEALRRSGAPLPPGGDPPPLEPARRGGLDLPPPPRPRRPGGAPMHPRRRRALLRGPLDPRPAPGPRRSDPSRSEPGRRFGRPDREAKLAAVVRIREQLGARAPTARLYQGYPFDRLRRRLGLPPNDPATIDPGDLASMSGKDLGPLDPASLDDSRLAEAYQSASSLRDKAASARFAAD